MGAQPTAEEVCDALIGKVIRAIEIDPDSETVKISFDIGALEFAGDGLAMNYLITPSLRTKQ